MCCQTANNRLDAGNSELASHIFGGNITGIMLCSTLCRLCKVVRPDTVIGYTIRKNFFYRQL